MQAEWRTLEGPEHLSIHWVISREGDFYELALPNPLPPVLAEMHPAYVLASRESALPGIPTR